MGLPATGAMRLGPWSEANRSKFKRFTPIHAFVGCCHGNLALAERKSEGLGSSSGRRCCLPILECFASEGAERVAGNKMALNVERVMDDGVNG